MARLAGLFRNPFSFLFARSSHQDRVAAYVIREHERGRSLTEILDDPYVRNRCTPEEQARLARPAGADPRARRRCSHAARNDTG